MRTLQDDLMEDVIKVEKCDPLRSSCWQGNGKTCIYDKRKECPVFEDVSPFLDVT